MLIGVISDSHDNLPKIDAAVRVLNQLGVERVLHAGDYCAPFAAFRYKGLKTKMFGVFGNNDAEKNLLRQGFESIGHEVKGRFLTMQLDGANVAVHHGDEPELLQALSRTQSYDLIISGHTHKVNQSQDGRTKLLNPGEICGYLSGKSTVATFDTGTRDIKILEI